MSFQFSDLAARIKQNGAIDPADVNAVRRWEWQDGAISRDEANVLFELNDLATAPSREWVDCFVEAISVYIVDQEQPHGYISNENAAWLMAHIDKDGRADTRGELELIVKVLEKAENAPNALKAYALRQLEQTILTGNGPTRDGSTICAGQIDDAEVTLLRRLIFAAGGAGPGCVSEEEAELLFRLKDATLDAPNSADWQQLFVQGVGNYLMAHSRSRQFSRAEAATHEAFMNDTSFRLGSFMAKIVQSFNPRTVQQVFVAPRESDLIAARTVAERADAEITPEENAWVERHIAQDNQLDDLEIALLDFIGMD